MNIRFIDKQLFKGTRKGIEGIEKIKEIKEIKIFNTRVERDENNEKRKSYFNDIIIDRNERYRYF